MREMKDSGVEWIGEIPKDWKVTKMKYIGQYINGYAFKPDDWSSQGKPIIRIQDLTGSNSSPNFYDGILPNKYLIKNGDILVSWAATLGVFIWKKEEGWLNQHIFKAIPNCKRMVKNFFFWLVKVAMDNMNHDNKHGIVMQHVTLDVFNNFSIPIPMKKIQESIGDYLDKKCTKIDIIITKQQQIIEKLSAYKQSIITETVTKGLESDVEMKDSGIEFIGKIPSHWKIIRLKFLLTYLIDCPHETPKYDADGKYLVIRTADQDLAILRKDEDMFRLSENEYQNRIRRMSLDKDDIVYGREGGRWGLACLVPESNRYCLGQRMLQFRCDRELFNPHFAVYALSSSTIYLQGSFDTMGSASPHVNISTVQNYAIAVPPIQEQECIAKELQMKCQNIDFEIRRRQRFIDKITEYKKSIIYEVVTGKRSI